ncbi:hypothetical protein SCHPADRAFT_687186 [Schizopora paradoxa]|uniref:Uncharacterized protein n=1 Tax=Schizopora paradoxa TaxID=27342 RepID=A0A0H2R3Z5_9AGAM|nr:hypothetical protein SCHPADRAFT_687186 [Schizopora paradoxa]
MVIVERIVNEKRSRYEIEISKFERERTPSTWAPTRSFSLTNIGRALLLKEGKGRKVFVEGCGSRRRGEDGCSSRAVLRTNGLSVETKTTADADVCWQLKDLSSPTSIIRFQLIPSPFRSHLHLITSSSLIFLNASTSSSAHQVQGYRCRSGAWMKPHRGASTI